ncbi:unnamed protein product [Calypogeia fissa]
MALSKQLVVVLGLALLAAQTVLGYDPTITTDYGIMNPWGGANFTSTAYEPANIPMNNGGLVLLPQFGAQFPGVVGLGISTLFFNAAGGAEVPPHIHPRATEIFYILTGTWYVGFIDTSNKLFDANLVAGDLFIFPIGLIHFQLVTSKDGATGFSAFNSENPGVSIIPTALFESSASLDNMVLAEAFNVTVDIIKMIKMNLA